MPSPTDLSEAPQTDYTSILSELNTLTRTHALVYDLAVGERMLAQFFNGDPAVYASKFSGKETSFAGFTRTCSEQLRALGQSEDRLRNSIRGHIVFLSLPAATQGKLLLSHLLELARCTNLDLRAQLAQATVENHWSIAALRDAVSQAKAGKFVDADSVEPGVQLADEPAELPVDAAKGLSVARLVSRGERLEPDFAQWVAAWSSVDTGKLNAKQKQRMQATLAKLEALVGAVKASLG